MAYVDGYVITIPKKNRAEYTKMAREGMRAWMKFGAVDYKECVLDDAKPKGVTRTFAKLSGATPKNDVWFSYIVYKNKKHRTEVNKKVMAYFESEPKFKDMMTKMPFDMKQFSYGGFTPVVEA